MYASIIYKEMISPITRALSKIQVIEIEENEASAHKYAKLYNLQLPPDDKGKVSYKIVQIKIS